MGPGGSALTPRPQLALAGGERPIQLPSLAETVIETGFVSVYQQHRDGLTSRGRKELKKSCAPQGPPVAREKRLCPSRTSATSRWLAFLALSLSI